MTATAAPAIAQHPVVSPETWLVAREALLEKEKELTRLRDELNSERLALPWVRVGKKYMFEGPAGKQSFADLFQGRNQLIVYHFMFGPSWNEGCPGCSFVADSIDSARMHAEPKGVSIAVISRAPFSMIEAFQKRMGWQFHWVSSHGSDFNYDFKASVPMPEPAGQGKGERSAISAFYRNEAGEIFHTYSATERGVEPFLMAYQYLDISPLGRNENAQQPMGWVRLHDKYENAAKPKSESCCSGSGAPEQQK